jgi:LemA protein
MSMIRTSLQQFQQAQAQLQGSFSRLIAVAEKLSRSENHKIFPGFSNQIEGTENRINVARRDYNGSVNTYNQKVRTISK